MGNSGVTISRPNLVIIHDFFKVPTQVINSLFFPNAIFRVQRADFIYVSLEDVKPQHLDKILKLTINKIQPFVSNLHITLPNCGYSYADMVEELFSNFEDDQANAVDLVMDGDLTHMQYG